MYSLFTIALPVLSAMKDGRKRLAWQTIRIGVIISLPLSSWLIFYSADILKLINQDYAQGSLSLQILLTSMIPLAVVGGVNALAYSYGNYKQVLIIGMAMNLPRTILYFILVPTYDSTGAAISYTIGSVIGLASSVVVAKQIRMEIFWKGLVIMLIISGGIACLLSYLQINYIIGFIATILFSYIIFFKLRILSRSDIQDILAILPPRVSNTIVRLSDDIQKKLKGQS
jgi:O-antigen/teichoic acid export membrane protein